MLAYDILPAGLLDTAIRGFGDDKALEGLDRISGNPLSISFSEIHPDVIFPVSNVLCAATTLYSLLSSCTHAPAVLVEGMRLLAGAGFFLRINTDKDVAESDRERLRSALYEQLLKFRLTPEADETKAVYIFDIRCSRSWFRTLPVSATRPWSAAEQASAAPYCTKARILASSSFTPGGGSCRRKEARNRDIDSAAPSAIESLAKEIALKTWVVKEI